MARNTPGASEAAWLRDLAQLLSQAKARFSDISWYADDGTQVFAHKAVVYARAAGSSFLVPAATSHTNDSTVSLAYNLHRSLSPGPSSRDSHDPTPGLRPSSPSASFLSVSPTVTAPLSLPGVDAAVFTSWLEFLYTGARGVEAFSVLFDGFDGGRQEGESEVNVVDKLRQDLLYCWRSKLFADMHLCVGDTTFATHRAILASRSPYFRSVLLGNYADSTETTFTLPSPPFTPASTMFCLGYIYSGTLEFGNRNFDLSTAFDIWRCAEYLSLSLLRDEIEEKIEAMLNPKRAARIYAFACAPDVNSEHLRQIASPIVVGTFGDVWNSSQIGNLDFHAQKRLVEEVCKGINAESLTSISKSVFTLRRRLALERSEWAQHIRSMLDAIEDRLRDALRLHLGEVVTTAAFVDLTAGVGFSTDVLEWVLELVVGGLTEATAPGAYQALVGSVLLREEGILMDASVLIKDAQAGILKYLKRKWSNSRSLKAFDTLDNWCLKELADELEVSVDDLLAPPTPPAISLASVRSVARPTIAKTTVRAPTESPRVRPVVRSTTSTVSAAPSTRTPRVSTTSTIASRTTTTTTTRTPVVRTPAASIASTRTATTSRIVSPTTPGRDTTKVVRPGPVSVSSTNAPVASAPKSPPKPTRAAPPLPSPSIPFPSSSSAPKAVVTPRAVTPTAKRTPSIAPSIASRTSVATVRTSGARTPTNSRPPLPTASAKGKEREEVPAVPERRISATKAVVAPTRSKSSISLRSTTSVKPPPLPTARLARPASIASIKTTTSVRTLSTAKPPVPKIPILNGTTPRPKLISASSKPPPAPPKIPVPVPTSPLGTTLLSPIPCIVTLSSAPSLRFKAAVRYVGPVLFDSGASQWVGVEVLESAITDEGKSLEWNDGSVDGVVYFTLTSGEGPEVVTESGRETPSEGSPGLRPSSRRSRRPSSAMGDGKGPRRGIFVQPQQIVYVL